MQKKLLYLTMLLVMSLSYGQFACPTLNGPNDGDTDVPVDAIISWNAVEGVPGYLVSIGTEPGGDNLVSQQNMGTSTSIQPPIGLPENTDIYVTINLFFFDRENIECSSATFRTEDVTTKPSCTTPRFPVDGLTKAEVGTTISWNYAPKATGYLLTLGTSPGAVDILDGENIVATPFYKPATDLPQDEEIFVRIVPYNENGNADDKCEEFSFTTSASEPLPGCTEPISPVNGAINVPLTPFLEWSEVLEADGYKVSIGSTPSQNDVLDQVIFTNNSTFVIDFEPNRTFFATIVTFNSAGDAIGCAQTTFSTTLGCGPFIDKATGELVSIAPEIDFPDLVSLCQNEMPYTISSKDTAEEYRWFKVNTDESEALISNTAYVALSEEGTYRYEAYNTATQSENAMECVSSQEFKVVSSEMATISKLDVAEQNGTIMITVRTDGVGDYEYALDAIDGPYQDSDVFSNLSIGPHTVFVRDKNGCGIVSKIFEPELSLEGFPQFFTPNGDGINDFWQFVPPQKIGKMDISAILIFDRYGNLLAQVDPRTLGWDGTFNGKLLPASDYWFRARGGKNRKIIGHFALKR